MQLESSLSLEIYTQIMVSKSLQKSNCIMIFYLFIINVSYYLQIYY